MFRFVCILWFYMYFQVFQKLSATCHIWAPDYHVGEFRVVSCRYGLDFVDNMFSYRKKCNQIMMVIYSYIVYVHSEVSIVFEKVSDNAKSSSHPCFRIRCWWTLKFQNLSRRTRVHPWVPRIVIMQKIRCLESVLRISVACMTMEIDNTLKSILTCRSEHAWVSKNVVRIIVLPDSLQGGWLRADPVVSFQYGLDPCDPMFLISKERQSTFLQNSVQGGVASGKSGGCHFSVAWTPFDPMFRTAKDMQTNMCFRPSWCLCRFRMWFPCSLRVSNILWSMHNGVPDYNARENWSSRTDAGRPREHPWVLRNVKLLRARCLGSVLQVMLHVWRLKSAGPFELH